MFKSIQSLTINTRFAAVLASAGVAVFMNSAQKNVWWWHKLN
jgi:hypothetical protein